jgi:2-methylcitrate dehydratase PrpD
MTSPVMSDPATAITSDNTESERLAQFTLGLTLQSLPPAVVELAKLHFLDVLGVALASSRHDFGRAILAGSAELGNGTEARAIGSGRRLPAASAALVNGTLAHGLDFDDTHIGAIYHASAPAFAAAVSVGDRLRASGAAVLLAYVTAMEVGCRIAAAAAGKFHDRGFHPTALAGTFAAAAATAQLHGDSQQSLVWALGLCGSQASGILELGGSWLKRFHPGWSAHAGITAAALGRHGFRGPRTVLEGGHGLYATHIGEGPSAQRMPSAQLGQEWLMLGTALKPYPCCHFIHAFVDAALALRGQLVIEQIERIDGYLHRRILPLVAAPRERCVRPATIYDALFSVHFVVAQALVKGRVDLSAFYDEPLDDAAVLRVADLVHVHEDPASDFPANFPGELRITLKDGRVLTRREPTSLGTPSRRLSAGQIAEKFHLNAARVVTPGRARSIVDAVAGLDALADIGELISLCVTDQGA